MPRFRLLHASDLHLSTVPYRSGFPDWLTQPPPAHPHPPSRMSSVSSHNPNILDAFASFAFVNRDQYDVILLSGDLATTGEPADLDHAHRFLEAPAVQGYWGQDGRPTLQATGKEIALLPGNHDRFGPPSPLYPAGDTTFDKVFANYWSAGQDAQVLWAGPRAGTYLVLVGVDLTLRTGDWGNLPPLSHYGQGRAYPDPIAALERITDAMRARYARAGTILWVIHFDPDASQGLLKLLDEGNLAQALRRKNIPAILCGHTHESRVKQFAKVPVYVCGTTTQ